MSERACRKRLVVFLDGTWNNKDDCTNVLNIYNLVRAGEVDGGWVQLKLYDEGVGTGVLDSISGGAFGDGLEINVRQAYDWLVEHFDDGGLGEDYAADEIYVFGFSRGAYTARSLVGFIARCGLLRRGAPLTVGQLWQGYGELERSNQEEHENLLDRLLNEGKFRQLSELVEDPWLGGRLRPAAGELNATEKLLVQWSSRVKITFLGVYDTVGALGLDALAIPGLRGKAGRLHNLRPSSIIQNFRHALGIDENRTSFQHAPLVEYRPHDRESEPRQGLEQRWFVGSHSNVGGGYEDNELAHRPLMWMVEEAQALGSLAIDTPRPRVFAFPGPAAKPLPRDSYAEFAWPLGTFLLRTQRNYRRLVPPDEVRAKRGEAASRAKPSQAGFALHSREVVDDSVWDYAAANPAYAPPNLIELAARAAPADPRARAVAARAVLHRWPSRLAGGHAGLFLWALFAGLGAAVVDGLFQIFDGSVGPWDWIAAGAAGFLAVAVDWLEGRFKLRLAAGRGNVRLRAVTDAIFWTRSILVIFFFAGLLGAAGFFFAVGWNYGPRQLGQAFLRAVEVGGPGWVLPVAVVAALLFFSLLGRRLGPVKEGETPPAPPAASFGRRLAAFFGWPAALLAVVALLILLGHSAWHIASQAFGAAGKLPELRSGQHANDNVVFAGHFLFLMVSLAYLARSLFWVGEPMSRANLGSMGALMGKTRPAAVTRVLERWQELLVCRWGDNREECGESARGAVRAAVAEGLWRDIVGLIPVYTIVLCYGLHFGAQYLDHRFLAEPLPLWWLIPAATAIADWVESGIHLSYLGKSGPFPRPGLLKVWIALLATLAKFAGLLAGGFAVLVFLFAGGYRIIVGSSFDGGWRGALAATLVLALYASVLLMLWGARTQIAAWPKRIGKVIPWGARSPS